MKKKPEPPPIKDPDTDEVLVPWGTMHEQLISLGLINANDKEINERG